MHAIKVLMKLCNRNLADLNEQKKATEAVQKHSDEKQSALDQTEQYANAQAQQASSSAERWKARHTSEWIAGIHVKYEGRLLKEKVEGLEKETELLKTRSQDANRLEAIVEQQKQEIAELRDVVRNKDDEADSVRSSLIKVSSVVASLAVDRPVDQTTLRQVLPRAAGPSTAPSYDLTESEPRALQRMQLTVASHYDVGVASDLQGQPRLPQLLTAMEREILVAVLHHSIRNSHHLTFAVAVSLFT